MKADRDELLIKVVSKSGSLPQFATSGSAGADIRAMLDGPVLIKPGDIAGIKTGLYMEIPEGYEVQIRARSGLAIRHGISMINGIGTIDSDYRGEVIVPLINLGKEDFVVNDGDRIAQMLVCKYESFKWQEEEVLSDTERGQGGFGHTGRG